MSQPRGPKCHRPGRRHGPPVAIACSEAQIDRSGASFGHGKRRVIPPGTGPGLFSLRSSLRVWLRITSVQVIIFQTIT